MLRKTLSLAALLVLLAPFARADETTALLLANAWPYDANAKLSTLGHGVGIVFSPDLSVEGNCRFYETLGFACFQSADWNGVLNDIRNHNIFHPENRIQTLILETHGTNGNGLKLQRSYDPKAERSYISVGALQERLEPDGVRTIIISACNSGRLLRPAIYRALDPHPGDKLFLPATCGIFDASADFDPRRSHIVVATPGSSHIETTLAGKVVELSPTTRRLLAARAKELGIRPPTQFAVSDMLVQILTRDQSLTLKTSGYVDELSKDIRPVDVSESLFKSFVRYVNGLAAREAPPAPPAQKRASAKGKKPAAKKPTSTTAAKRP